MMNNKNKTITKAMLVQNLEMAKPTMINKRQMTKRLATIISLIMVEVDRKFQSKERRSQQS